MVESRGLNVNPLDFGLRTALAFYGSPQSPTTAGTSIEEKECALQTDRQTRRESAGPYENKDHSTVISKM